MALKTKLFLLCLLPVLAHATSYDDYHAKQAASNQAMKTCLLANGYSGEVFYGYNFSKAAACFHDWKDGQLREEYIKAQLWLEENPWYKGSHWKWEELSKQYPGRRTTIKRY